MKKTSSHVILSAAQDLVLARSSQWRPEILRGAQDDIWRQVCNSMYRQLAKVLLRTEGRRGYLISH
jgi:hypothetical protein